MIELNMEEGKALIGTKREKFFRDIMNKMLENIEHAEYELELNKEVVKILERKIGKERLN